MAKKICLGFALTLALALAAQAQPEGCNARAASPSLTISLPSAPFAVAPTRDGCWVFVSLVGGQGNTPGIAVLKRSAGRIELARVVPLKSAPTGIVLTHDGKLLIAAATSAKVVLDVQQMIQGAGDPVLGSFTEPRTTGSIYANVTADDKLLFVSEENAQTITVIDLERARRDGYKPDAVIGKIPTGAAPIALTFSSDGKLLYTTSQFALPDWNWPKSCKPETPALNSPLVNPQGAVIVVDVARARTDPEHSVVARVPAGCSPVRMAISPAGDRIFVTARNSNALLTFDTAKLVSDSEHARIGVSPLGSAPVPVAVVDGGRKVVAGNSNRFANDGTPQTLSVLDAARIGKGSGAWLGTIPVGEFPREMRLTADGRTLFLTNFGSNSLQMMDVDHLPVTPGRPPELTIDPVTLASRHTDVTLDAKVLARYQGAYQAPNGQAILVTLEGDRLSGKVGGMPAAAMVPESEFVFFLRAGMEIEFPKEAGSQGKANQAIVHQFGTDTTASRLDDAAAKRAQEAASALEKRVKDRIPLPGSEEALRKLITSLQGGDPDENTMSPGAPIHQQLDQLKKEISGFGAIQEITFTGVGPAGPDIYLVKTGKGTWQFRIWLSPEGKIEQVIAGHVL